jgi:hypothetical protein
MWWIGLPVAALLEDMRGALCEGQDGLVRRNARMVGQCCAVVLNLVLFYDRPLPAQRMRASWALERLAGHPQGEQCRLLVTGRHDYSIEELVKRTERLVDQVRSLAGDPPDPLAPDGYFPALAAAREWLRFIELVGEEGFLPREWQPRASTTEE